MFPPLQASDLPAFLDSDNNIIISIIQSLSEKIFFREKIKIPILGEIMITLIESLPDTPLDYYEYSSGEDCVDSEALRG